jgi:RNA polymerase sigma factor (TIGR02999 family)
MNRSISRPPTFPVSSNLSAPGTSAGNSAASAFSELTLLLNLHRRGDYQASAELLPLIYDDLRRHAASRIARDSASQTLQATALVHEAWLRLSKDDGQRWQNRAHFFGAAAEAMRRILIEAARRKARLKRGRDWHRVEYNEVDHVSATPDEKILLLDEALQRLETEDPVKARIVTLKFFGGQTNQEVAEILGVTERTVERYWAYAKAWLIDSIHGEQ